MAYSTINKSTDYFNTKLYSGNATARSITGVGFQPDFTWIKNRSYSHNHVLSDAVRGSNKAINSDTNSVEVTDSSNGYVTGFVSDGFSISNSDYGWVNNSSSNYVSWNWKANGAGSANTDGSITSTVSANTTAGFSVVKFTTPSSGTMTIGHGLGAVPKVWLHKRLDGTDNWQMYHHSIGNTKKLMLNSTGAEGTSAIWQDTTPTSSLMYLGDVASVVNASANYIAYCFAEKAGYSKFGSYKGNGSTDGAFVYTGFKPAFIIVKRTNGTANWVLFDNKRSGFNVANDEITPNLSSAENSGQSYQYVDLLSNGFKWREASNNKNSSNDDFIFMAFGQSLVGSNNVPCTAR